MLDRRPVASDEMVRGYHYTASLAQERHDRMEPWDKNQAKPYALDAEYCYLMAVTRATDDDQYQFQRDSMRHRKGGDEVLVMTPEEMDAQGLFVVDDTESRRLEPQQEAILLLALGYLSATQRKCFELSVGGKLSPKAIAQREGIKESVVRQHLMRARRIIERKVRPALEPLWASEE